MAKRAKPAGTGREAARQGSAKKATRKTAALPAAPTKDFSTLRLPAVPETTTGRTPVVRAPDAGGDTSRRTAAPRTDSRARRTAAPTPPVPPRERPTARIPRVGEETSRMPVPAPEGFTGERLPALPQQTQTRAVVIPGSGKPHGLGYYVPRRERPLAMRLAVVTLTVCIVFSGLFTVAPLGASGVDAARGSSLQAISNAVIWHASPGFFWYTAAQGDTVEKLAAQFHCQIGGIYELNNMLSGQELQIGVAYKIPTDPNYGQYFQPPGVSVYTGGGVLGPTTYDPYHADISRAGVPPYGALCGPSPHFNGGDPSNLGNYVLSSFDLKAPNPGAYWVRGFTWYHHGVDLANPAGTPIHAAQSGEVLFANWDTWGGGWSVKINHCNGLATEYLHMEQLFVHVHDMVHVGDVIGLEGSTGWSTGPHLHFYTEFYHVPVDPMLFFGGDNATGVYNITHIIPDA
jgi:murein DD-endopeptidase MepM/ murein hydrolase activator NlpD